jgi:predicted N-acetyltransferase YhbS
MKIRQYTQQDIPAMTAIWNRVVEDGIAFPQLELLNNATGAEFFGSQTYCGVAEIDGAVFGLYILHPNNIGRCGHIANASYAVAADRRGQHIGEALVSDSLVQAKRLGFKTHSAVLKRIRKIGKACERFIGEDFGFSKKKIVEREAIHQTSITFSL